jgi:RNA polymerase sigma-70 factor (sigma-E family)
LVSAERGTSHAGVPIREPDKMSDEDFAEFVAGSLSRLLRFGHVLTGDPEAAADLVQEALARTLRAWRRQSIEDPHAFVRKVMVNCYASAWRRNRRAGPATTLELAELPVGLDNLRVVEERDAVWRALRVLPPRQRAVTVLRYYDDLTVAEIAAVMGTSTGTVKSQSARALRRLEALLTEQPPRDGDGQCDRERGVSR